MIFFSRGDGTVNCGQSAYACSRSTSAAFMTTTLLQGCHFSHFLLQQCQLYAKLRGGLVFFFFYVSPIILSGVWHSIYYYSCGQSEPFLRSIRMLIFLTYGRPLCLHLVCFVVLSNELRTSPKKGRSASRAERLFLISMILIVFFTT